ncbi:MAG TPA: hypothetical protein VFS12_06740, partial [Terriglobia bacterium]|nr:hypothetical protein [Terriglobia bacterium]
GCQEDPHPKRLAGTLALPHCFRNFFTAPLSLRVCGRIRRFIGQALRNRYCSRKQNYDNISSIRAQVL